MQTLLILISKVVHIVVFITFQVEFRKQILIHESIVYEISAFTIVLLLAFACTAFFVCQLYPKQGFVVESI